MVKLSGTGKIIFLVVVAFLNIVGRCRSFEIGYVLEPFEGISDTAPTTDVISELEVTTSSTNTTTNSLLVDLTGSALFGNQALNVSFHQEDETTAARDVTIQSLLEDERTHKCRGAIELSVWYQVEFAKQTSEQVPAVVDWSISLFVQPDGDELETWISNISVTNETDKVWQELVVPVSRFSPLGNGDSDDIMDLNHIKGWRIDFKVSPNSSGFNSLLLDQLIFRGGGEILGAALYAKSWEHEVMARDWMEFYHFSNISRDNTYESLSGVEDGTLQIDYSIEHTEVWGGFMQLSHIPPSRAYYNLSTAGAVSFQYNTLESSEALGRTHFRLLLLDGSDCIQSCGDRATQLENYYSFLSILDVPGNGTVSLELDFDVYTGDENFVWTGWFGTVGNHKLDKEIIKGFKFEVVLDAQGEMGSIVNGSVAVRNLTANEVYQNYTTPSLDYCTVEPELAFRDFRNQFRRIEYKNQGECCQACIDDESCHYAISSWPHCYLKEGQLLPGDIELRYGNEAAGDDLVFLKETAETAGDFCERCECDESTQTIDCRNRNLVFSPNKFSEDWSPTKLDLRDNPRLLILSSKALQHLSKLETLLLPTNLTYVPPTLATKYSSLQDIVIEGDQRNLLNAVTSEGSSEGFGDICCGKGNTVSSATASGSRQLTFCNYQADSPGRDAVFEDFVYYFQAHQNNVIHPTSDLYSEAAESPQKCAQYCQISSDCRYFQYDGRYTLSAPSCTLLSDKGTPQLGCCEQEHYNDTDLVHPGWVAGYPPQTRYEVDNARVLITSAGGQKLEATESNGYQSSYFISLGAMPLRGAVWVQPKSSKSGRIELSFSPPRVVLYDNFTVAEVKVSVTNTGDITDGGGTKSVVITNAVDSCDAAFLSSNACSASDDLAISMDVLSPKVDSKGALTIYVTIALVFLLVVSISFWMLSEHKRRKADSVWLIEKEELSFSDPPVVLARGGFGNVLLGEWRGTQVAVKRAIPASDIDGRAIKGKHRIEAFDLSYSLMRSRDKIASSSAFFSVCASPMAEEQSGDIDLESLPGKVPEHGLSKELAEQAMTIPAKRVSSRFGSSITSSDWESALQTKGGDYWALRKNFIREMRLLSRVRHPNVTTMMGAVISPTEEPMLVMEYMEFGSLADLLRNKTLFIDEEQIYPILHDVTQGMRFLHANDPQIIHGDLKSKNILIDNKLRAKVGDFGFAQCKKRQHGATGTPYWMAPELLRGTARNSAESDAFSFGVVLWEAYSREPPYKGEDHQQVLQGIMDLHTKKRPPVPSNCPEQIHRIIQNCFEDNPSLRPTFKQLDMQLFEMKQVYARQKDNQIPDAPETSSLLEEMFPPHIASALREGKQIEPQHHDSVTVLFIDIVGFTGISAGLSPMQVSDMLHRLYSKFDALSRAMGVFKVETIGDSWMGVTNLMEDQGNDHVKRAADFAEAAMQAASETWINEDNHNLGCVRLRAGFHSGQVVSNVVGSRSPRYCLFGDTVNTASRMESNSSAGRIQCSDTSATLLEEQDPTRILQPRGLQHIKGKGLMMLYWCES